MLLGTRVEKKLFPHKAFIGPISCGKSFFFELLTLPRYTKNAGLSVNEKLNKNEYNFDFFKRLSFFVACFMGSF
jgi:hypothetical protein